MSDSELLSKIGEISYQEYVSEWNSHPVFYGDLVDVQYWENEEGKPFIFSFKLTYN